jgi:hypothetical protein
VARICSSGKSNTSMNFARATNMYLREIWVCKQMFDCKTC